MAKKRLVLSESELLEYSKEHVLYEITMLVGAARLLEYRVETPSGLMLPPHWNAAVESFAIHLRNLIDFLYPSRVFPTDVLADDFFPAGRPSDFPHLTATLENARTRAHKELSHLTTARFPSGHPDKGWNTKELLKQVFAVLQIFAENADASKLHNDVAGFIQRFVLEGSRKEHNQ